MEYILIEFLGTVRVFHVDGDLLVGEEHEVLDENFCGLFQSLFGVNRPVGGNFQIQLLVVGLLLDAVVFDRVLHVLDGREDRVDRKRSELAFSGSVLLGRHVAAAFADRERHLHLRSRGQVTDHQVGIEDLEERQVIRDISGSQLRNTRNVNGYFFGILIIDCADKTNLLQIEDDVQHILHHTGDSGKLVIDTGYLDSRDCVTLQRREQNTTQSVTDSHTESGLQRSEFELPERRSGFKHNNLLRFLEC